MKYATPTALFLASVAVATPAPEPSCFSPGQPCSMVKRASDAAASVMNQARSLDKIQARTATEADIYAAEALTEITGLLGLADHDPLAFYAAIGLDPKQATNPAEKRSEHADLDVGKRWCFRFGGPCKRSEQDLENEKRWCFRFGGPCKRDARENKRACSEPGHACYVAKRAAEDVLDALADEDAKRSPSEDAQESKRWCFRFGGPCRKAKRDLEAIEHVARSIVETF